MAIRFNPQTGQFVEVDDDYLYGGDKLAPFGEPYGDIKYGDKWLPPVGPEGALRYPSGLGEATWYDKLKLSQHPNPTRYDDLAPQWGDVTADGRDPYRAYMERLPDFTPPPKQYLSPTGEPLSPPDNDGYRERYMANRNQEQTKYNRERFTADRNRTQNKYATVASLLGPKV